MSLPRPDPSLLPLDITNLNNFNFQNLIYVDKSDLVAEMAKESSMFLLSRPRRFGKTTLVNAFKILFSQGREGFRKYMLYNHWQEERIFPVVHVDFSDLAPYSYESFASKAFGKLQIALQNTDVELDEEELDSQDPLGLMEKAVAGMGEGQFVLLLEEADTPLAAALVREPGLYKQILEFYEKFFKLLLGKARPGIRFALVTSTLNLTPTLEAVGAGGLEDITLNPSYSQILGFTQQEVQDYLDDYVTYFAAANQLTKEQAYEGLREYYGGYCFDPQGATQVFHPASLLSCLKNPQLGLVSYWSGGRVTDRLVAGKYALHVKDAGIREQFAPLVRLQERLESAMGDGQVKGGAVLKGMEDVDEIAVLFQAGFLGIRRSHAGRYFLGKTNRETELALLKALVE